MAYQPVFVRNRRLLPAMLFSGGLCVAGYYGLQWRDLPQFSEHELEQSTELNLALDLASTPAERRPQGAELEAMKARVRAEVESDVAADRKTMQERFAAGLIAMVFGLGQLIFVAMSERARK